MPRLTEVAFDLLASEVNRLSDADLNLGIQRELVLKRLLRLHNQQGDPVTEAELKEALDLFPHFDAKLITRAVQLSRPSRPVLGWFKAAAIASGVLGAMAGGIWVANLPYPMVRWPVAKVAPIILLPSFMEMDHHYRQAISLVEQSDQLVNNATGAADIKLGKKKVALAQQSLDKLPVWFLGYYPQRYCTMFACAWQFTLDEFEGARRQVGRMEAKVFQEEQALGLWDTATVNLDNARGLYETIPNQVEAIALWQSALDDLHEIPHQTLAGRLAQTQLEAAHRDFAQVAGNAAGETKTATMLTTAKGYANAAVATAQNAPHPSEVWEKAKGQWKDAIAELNEIPTSNPGYVEAQALKAQYKDNLGDIQIRLKQERDAATAFGRAQQDYTRFLGKDYTDSPQRYRSDLQQIINTLQDIKAGTTAYAKAEAMHQNLQELL